MKKAFIEKLLRERIVNTRKYRYAVVSGMTDGVEYIERFPIEHFGSPAAFDHMECIAVVVDGEMI